MKEFTERNIDSIAQILEDTMCNKTDENIRCIYQNILSINDDVGKQSKAKTIW